MISLMISDRIKSILPEHCLKHILSIESSIDKPFWLGPDRLAVVVDEYMANLGNSNRATSAFIGQITSVRRFTNFTNAAETRSSGARPENLSFDGQNVRNSSVKSFGSNNTKRRCFRCGSFSHLQAQCDKVKARPNHTSRRVNASSLMVGGRESASAEYAVVRDMQAGAPTQCESAATVVTGKQNVNRVTVATGRSDEPVAQVSHGGVSVSKHESVQSSMNESADHLFTITACSSSDDCNVEQYDAYIDSIVSLFADFDDKSDCFINRTETINSSDVKFDIHKIVADCETAMHYVDIEAVDSSDNAISINALFDSGHKCLF